MSQEKPHPWVLVAPTPGAPGPAPEASIQVRPDLVFGPLPEWFLGHDLFWESAGGAARHRVAHHPIGFVMDYEGTTLDVAATERALTWITLGCWLVQPAAYGVYMIAHFERPQPDDEWIFRHSKRCPPRVALLEGEDGTPLDDTGWRTAARLADRITSLDSQGAVVTAAAALSTALGITRWEQRYLSNRLATEALYGPSDGREITYRLAQRVSLFLEATKPAASALAAQMRKDYGWRSKTVHGLKLNKLKPGESLQLTRRIEDVNRRSLRKILEESLAPNFDGRDRESHLDGLVFELLPE